MIKAVIDSNVHVSALLNGTSTPGMIIKAARDQRFISVLSPSMMSELRNTLKYPKLRKYLKHTNEELERYITSFEIISEEINDEPNGPSICRDPDDDLMIYVGLRSNANYLVSGDKDLLVLESVQKIMMISPIDFLSRIDRVTFPRF